MPAERWDLIDEVVEIPMVGRGTSLDEQAGLRERADAEGIAMQEAARRAVREYVVHGRDRDRVSATARRVMAVHAESGRLTMIARRSRRARTRGPVSAEHIGVDGVE